LRTGWTNPAVLTVPVIVSVQPAIMVIPAYVTLPAGPLANALTNSIAIENRSTNALRLSDATVNVPGVEAQIREMRPGMSFTAMLAFPQGFQAPPGQQVELSIKSSSPKYPVLKVPVMQLPRPAMAPPRVVPVVPVKVSPQAAVRPPPPPPPLPRLPVSH
jgi:hypothetical protein